MIHVWRHPDIKRFQTKLNKKHSFLIKRKKGVAKEVLAIPKKLLGAEELKRIHL